MRKQFILTVGILLLGISIIAQKKPEVNRRANPPAKKYSSLLWEITGNGLTRPSYLFGTMHVSDKLAFHLGDSFYHAIRKVDVVALETNPETWQDNYSESVFLRGGRSRRTAAVFAGMADQYASDRLSISSFSFDSYEDIIKASLAVEPSMINGMLYRTYGTQLDDFEEDTFLDMYIFQVGKKLGKKLTGVENFEESEKLVMEAYRDMMKDKNRKRKSYDFEGMLVNPKKLEEAYRRGDLDMLDSLEALTVFSDAFQEKFLYKRNEIQANSIDTILKKHSLFVGVGAAHLPGRRGVIEMLRKMGYKLRAVKMDDRNSVQKEQIDRMRAKAKFVSQTSADGFYKVSIPGAKFYKFTDWGLMDIVQYADLINGAYYTVNRIKTNSNLLGHSPELVQKKIDSFLYENIPGKMLKKQMIFRNGYRGLEVINRTRRGDHQRYNIYITPFEVIIFKMSGNGDYILNGDEAQQFFQSVQLKPYNATAWVHYQPPTGGFAVQFPHEPSILKGNRLYEFERFEFSAYDEKEGNSYWVVKKSLHNHGFIEEDSFELNLMEESYASSAFIDTMLSRTVSLLNGYASLQTHYRHIDGSFSTVKFVIQGANHYAVGVKFKKETPSVSRFLGSFKITAFLYPADKDYRDSVMAFTVKSPVIPSDKKMDSRLIELQDELENIYDEEFELLGSLYTYKAKAIGNDTTGEKIFIYSNKVPEYFFQKDSTKMWYLQGDTDDFVPEHDSSFIYKTDTQYILKNGIRCHDIELRDTGSSRSILSRTFLKEGYYFNISTLIDTLSGRSAFVNKFFGTFMPADTLKSVNIYTRKTEKFFADLFGKDSVQSRKAVRLIHSIRFDSLDVPLVIKAIDSLHWGIRNYMATKKTLITKMGRLKDPRVTQFFKSLYFKVGDTAAFQHAILEALLEQRTAASFAAFKELVLQEPPIADAGNDRDFYPRVVTWGGNRRMVSDYDGRWSPLYDTLGLTKTIFPDLLQLVNVDDYKEEMMKLLQRMVDSGQLKGSEYESYFSKLYLEGKQLLKKQVAYESQTDIERAVQKQNGNESDPDEMDIMQEGNDALNQYAVLLLPFIDSKPGVKEMFAQLIKLKDKELVYNTLILLLRNKQPVPDSLLHQYAADDGYRMKLYDDLKKIKQTERFPAAQKTQLSYARSSIYASLNGYSKPDSLVYIDRLPVFYKNKKGWVYFFKFRSMRDDPFWQLASVGMQPDNEGEIDTENIDFQSTGGVKIESDLSVRAQMETMLKELLNAKRPSAEGFYEARGRALFKNYLTEFVKNSRYRD